MTNIYFKYGNYTTTTSITWATPQSLNATIVYTKLRREVVGGTTLRGKKFQHKKNFRNAYDVTISANELYNVTTMNYILNFFSQNSIIAFFIHQSVNVFP